VFDDERAAAAADVDVPVADPPFERPHPSLLARFIHSPKRQPFFFKVRALPPFEYLASTRVGGNLLYRTGLRQDVFVKDDAVVLEVSFDASLCRGEGACRAYCPVPMELPVQAGDPREGCVHCLYCVQVCPSGALSWKGEAGFQGEQERQYGEIIPQVARTE
jgi:ferredoxin